MENLNNKINECRIKDLGDVFNPDKEQKNKQFIFDNKPNYILDWETGDILVYNDILDKYEKTNYKIFDHIS